MSLIVLLAFKDFTVICSDGLTVRVENGVLVPTSQEMCKYWTVGNGDIAMGATGSGLMFVLISNFSYKLAEQHRDNPELFSVLEKAVPDELRRLNKLFPTDHEYFDGTESVNLGGTNFLLTGYDASQQKMRSIFWGHESIKGDLTPRDCAGRIMAIGSGKGGVFVTEKLDVDDCFGPLDVAETTKSIIQQASAAFPNSVGRTTYSHVISIPGLKDIIPPKISGTSHPWLQAKIMVNFKTRTLFWNSPSDSVNSEHEGIRF